MKSKAKVWVLTNSSKIPQESEGEVTSVYHVTILQEDESSLEEEDIQEAPERFESGNKSTVDELNEVNLGEEGEHRPTFLSANLTQEEVGSYVKLLKEYRDVFAWNFKEMPGLDPKIAVHKLAVKPGVRPVKQAQRRFRPELIPLIEDEVNKLIEAGFIREVKYPTWIANIVPVKKKNGQLRICV
ncbi:hypothetical protein, partial [Haemophilus sp. SZY H57]